MRIIRRLTIGTAMLLGAAAASALTPTQLSNLRAEVLQMCRGGTLTGTRISSSAMANGRLITLDGVLAGDGVEQVFVSREQWSGIEALLINSSDYTACVNSTVAMLAPLIEEKQNLDTNLNARLTYIDSPVFCERLVYVISRAPSRFEEWRMGPPTSSRWEIGSYLMKNADALGMTSNSSTRLDSATIETRNDGSFGFSEPLVYTHRFDARNETGLIVDKIRKSFDACLTPGRFRSVKGVRWRDGSRVMSSGTVTWAFDETGRFGATSDTFDVFLSVLDQRAGLRLPTSLVYVHVESP